MFTSQDISDDDPDFKPEENHSSDFNLRQDKTSKKKPKTLLKQFENNPSTFSDSTDNSESGEYCESCVL